MAVSATYTKDIHYSGIITVDGETVVSMQRFNQPRPRA